LEQRQVAKLDAHLSQTGGDVIFGQFSFHMHTVKKFRLSWRISIDGYEFSLFSIGLALPVAFAVFAVFFERPSTAQRESRFP
jgi:hypothetical protein